MTRVRLVADDLTGALDSGVQFVGRFGPLPILFGVPDAPPPGSFAIDTACRDGSEAEALARIAAATPLLSGADIAFKKIDSLLRGHWAAELAVMVRERRFARIVLAPAFPALGRITRDGRQHMRQADGGWDELLIDPAASLVRHGIRVTRAPNDRDDAVLLCDATSNADLAAIVQSAGAQTGPTLWCGTAGLALALSGRAPPLVRPTAGSHLIIVGSNHAVAQAQVAAVAATDPAWIVRFDEDAVASAARITRTLADQGRCVALADLPDGVSAADAAARIAQWLEGLLPRLASTAMLTVVGGETFAAVCRALHATGLSVEGEWRTGVPASRLIGCGWTETLCFSKSGAFGDADWLAALLARNDAKRIDCDPQA